MLKKELHNFFLLWCLSIVESKRFDRMLLRISHCFLSDVRSSFVWMSCARHHVCQHFAHLSCCVHKHFHTNRSCPRLPVVIELSLAIFVAHSSGGEYFWRFILWAPDGVQTDQRSFPPGARYSVPCLIFFNWWICQPFANHFSWPVMELVELYRNHIWIFVCNFIALCYFAAWAVQHEHDWEPKQFKQLVQSMLHAELHTGSHDGFNWEPRQLAGHPATGLQ